MSKRSRRRRMRTEPKLAPVSRITWQVWRTFRAMIEHKSMRVSSNWIKQCSRQFKHSAKESAIRLPRPKSKSLQPTCSWIILLSWVRVLPLRPCRGFKISSMPQPRESTQAIHHQTSWLQTLQDYRVSIAFKWLLLLMLVNFLSLGSRSMAPKKATTLSTHLSWLTTDRTYSVTQSSQ